MVRARGLAGRTEGKVLPLLGGVAVTGAGFGLAGLACSPSLLSGIVVERQAVFGLWGFARDGT
ncbi:MAG: hypothetical protein ONB15_12120 [candidate division KSB1 bacterium]|nr:hypothetical protein [candidate division KSB1 bacterium]